MGLHACSVTIRLIRSYGFYTDGILGYIRVVRLLSRSLTNSDLESKVSFSSTELKTDEFGFEVVGFRCSSMTNSVMGV